jgi:hypothetical protein
MAFRQRFIGFPKQLPAILGTGENPSGADNPLPENFL